MKIKRYNLTIQRFKQTGKYYDEIGFKTDASFIFEIVEEIRTAIKNGELAGEFIHLITGAGHPDGYPQLVLPSFEQAGAE